MGIKVNFLPFTSLMTRLFLAEDEQDTHYMLRKLNEEYTSWGLTVNPSKTDYVVAESQGKNLIFFVI